MRNSPCKAHFQKHAAVARSADDAAPVDRLAANAYELMLAKLAEDKRRLKDVQSMERKAEVKAKLLPEYLPWIEGVLEADTGRQDDVLMTVFVWAIDIGDFSRALSIGTYAIAHRLSMPDQYKRDVPCVLAEEIADYAAKASEDAIIALLPHIDHAIALTDKCDMPDEVRAKLYKAWGYGMRAGGQLVGARDALTRALQLHAKVGVKKDIERLDTLIKNSSPPVNADPSAKTEGA